MSISCICGGSLDEYAWMYYPPNDYINLNTKRGRHCVSCKGWIKVGELCSKFSRIRAPRSEWEENFHGDEVSMAPVYMCEYCSDIFFSITELGYCITLNSSMDEELETYKEISSIKK